MSTRLRLELAGTDCIESDGLYFSKFMENGVKDVYFGADF